MVQVVQRLSDMVSELHVENMQTHAKLDLVTSQNALLVANQTKGISSNAALTAKVDRMEATQRKMLSMLASHLGCPVDQTPPASPTPGSYASLAAGHSPSPAASSPQG